MVEENEIIELIKNGGIKTINEENDSLGKDLQVIASGLTDDKNVYRFSHIDKRMKGYDALLGAISERGEYDKRVKPRYSFIRSFRYHLAINNSAVDSEAANRYKELGSSLLAFKALWEIRNAVNNNDVNDEKKHGLLDRIKKT